MSIIEIKDYQEYIDLIQNTHYIKLLIFSKENCSACNKSLIKSKKLLQSFDSKKLIFKEIKMYSDNQKNLANSKIFENYRINFVPSYVLIYNNTCEIMRDPEIRYVKERIKYILKLKDFSP